MHLAELMNTERWESIKNVKLRDGALVEIGFHILFQRWVGTIYNFKIIDEQRVVVVGRVGEEVTYKDAVHKTPLEINEVVFSERRRDIPGLLRLKYLQAINPKLREVHERVAEESLEYAQFRRGFEDARELTVEGMKREKRDMMEILRRKRMKSR